MLSRDTDNLGLHRLARMVPAGPRRLALAHAGALLAAAPELPAPAAAGGIWVAGELDRATGLGEAARLMRTGLASLGVPSWGSVVTGRPGRLVAPPEDLPPGAPLLLAVNGPHLPLALARLGGRAVRGRLVIGLWAWDLPSVPANWRIGARFVHEVWAPADFAVAALSGLLPGRVRRVRPCLAVAPPRPAAMDRAAFGLPADALVTLVSFNLASSRVRKNPEAAIAAHRLAFGERADRILLLKIGHPGDFPRDFAELRALVGAAANIRIITDTLPPREAHALTRAADVVLSLHRSEGFGLVPAEAMMLGRAVVATGWSGNLDFMAPGAAALVPYRLVPARDPRGVFEAPGAVWAEADVAAAAVWLRRLADDPGLRAGMGAQAALMARARLGTGDLRAAVSDLGLSGEALACAC